jgi:hypothetical protein
LLGSQRKACTVAQHVSVSFDFKLGLACRSLNHARTVATVACGWPTERASAIVPIETTSGIERYLAVVTPPFFFRCPTTGKDVKGFVVEEIPGDEPKTYMPVTCLVCGQTHLLNLKTRKTIEEDRPN